MPGREQSQCGTHHSCTAKGNSPAAGTMLGQEPWGSPLTTHPEEGDWAVLSCCEKSLSYTHLHYEHSLNIQLHRKSSGKPYTLIFLIPGLTHLVNSHVVGDPSITQDQTSACKARLWKPCLLGSMLTCILPQACVGLTQSQFLPQLTILKVAPS